jgi:hypothetical protein
VSHPILAQHTAAGASLGAHMPTEESDEDTDVDPYLNTANVLHSAGTNIVTTYLNCHLFQLRTKLTTMFHL